MKRSQPPSFPRLAYRAALIPTMLAAFGMPACNDPRTSSDQKDFDLAIRPAPDTIASPEPDPETGFATERFDLPIDTLLTLLRSIHPASDTEPLVNPFADPSPSQLSGPAQQAFESAGIRFPTGTSALYDAEAARLEVVQTAEAMALIRYLIDMHRDKPTSAALRFELYEVPALLALRLEQSAAAHLDDTPEWNALQPLLGKDGIRLLRVATLQSQSGQRTKFEDGETFVYRSGTGLPPKGEKDEDAAEGKRFEERLVGTLIEAEVGIASDHHTLNLNFKIEHHTAPPEWIPTSVGRARTDAQTATVFHAKTLTANFTIHDGSTCLLTSWTPTGKPEYAEHDRRILVFVSANVRRE